VTEPPVAELALSCPRCGFDQTPPIIECARCGVLFSRLADGPRQPPPAFRHEVPRPSSLEPEAKRAVAIGFGIALVTLAVPFLRFIMSYLIILVHELGHTLTGWVFGYPSIPAFDFRYGGGVTSHDQRQIVIVALVLAGIAWGLHHYRNHRPALVVVSTALFAYGIAAFTPLHSLLMTFMGHGTELIFAGIFFYRALSGSAVRIPVERPLYAFLGFFITISCIRFAGGLIFDPLTRILYEDAKGGGHWMDFSVIAEQYLGVQLSLVAWFFLPCCLIPPLGAFLFHRYRKSVLIGLGRLLQPESGRQGT
jgi:hypothetical protein